MPTKVAAKKAANPAAAPIRRLANQPSSPMGMPNKFPCACPDIPSACDPRVIPVEYFFMAEGVQNGLLRAVQVAHETAVHRAPNGIAYAAFGDNSLEGRELERMVQAVPSSIAAALARKAYYFVPLALSEGRAGDSTLVAPAYTTELGDQATCHRNVTLDDAEGVFISTRLMGDRFALAFEFFINVGHAFVDTAGVPESFQQLAWSQAVADVRGETSQDAWESRHLALAGRAEGKGIDERAKTSFVESAFSDAVAIYLLSLSIDFDYAELREREYPLLAPQALADRLRLVAKLFPPNSGYEFSIRYRRRV